MSHNGEQNLPSQFSWTDEMIQSCQCH